MFQEFRIYESSLFYYNYAKYIWNWLGNFLNNGSVITSLEECMELIDDAHSSQCHVVVITEVLNCATCIWNTRNQVRFQNKKIH